VCPVSIRPPCNGLRRVAPAARSGKVRSAIDIPAFQTTKEKPWQSRRKQQPKVCIAFIDVVGSSATVLGDAAKNAVETASKSIRDLRIAEVTKLDVRVDNGKVVAFRTASA
jgi:flavin-binding protein dodecin